MNSLLSITVAGLVSLSPTHATSLSCWEVGYNYNAASKTETFFVRRTGRVLGTFVDANAPAPDPRRAAEQRGLCANYPAV